MPTATEAAAYIGELVAEYPSISEVWLLGSRANGSARSTSDWDYLAFADDATLAALRGDERFRRDGIDLMVVWDGVQFEKPWPDSGGRLGSGTLEFCGWDWKRCSATEATYRATKPANVEGLSPRVFTGRAMRVYPDT